MPHLCRISSLQYMPDLCFFTICGKWDDPSENLKLVLGSVRILLIITRAKSLDVTLLLLHDSASDADQVYIYFMLHTLLNIIYIKYSFYRKRKNIMF